LRAHNWFTHLPELMEKSRQYISTMLTNIWQLIGFWTLNLWCVKHMRFHSLEPIFQVGT
jgi:hypothetical protein